MNIEELIKQKLANAFSDVRKVDVINEGGTCSTAAKVSVLVVSGAFEGLSRLQRHRMVHEALSEEIKAHLHAITIKVQAPSEI